MDDPQYRIVQLDTTGFTPNGDHRRWDGFDMGPLSWRRFAAVRDDGEVYLLPGSEHPDTRVADLTYTLTCTIDCHSPLPVHADRLAEFGLRVVEP